MQNKWEGQRKYTWGWTNETGGPAAYGLFSLPSCPENPPTRVVLVVEGLSLGVKLQTGCTT
jgi:hypothetical protein